MPEDATRDFGAYLREARERAGITLRAIANNTKISVPTLEALERNDVARLPGGIFIRAFVRSYAKEVGLDPEDAVRRFVSRFPDAAVEESPAAYEANPEKIVVDEQPTTGRLWRVVGWSLPLLGLITFIVFGGRLSWWRELAQPAAPRTEAQAEQAPPAPATPVLTTPVPAAPVPATPAPAPPPEPSSPPPTGGADGTGVPASPAARPADAPVQAGEAPPAAVLGEGQFRLALTPRGRCWVTVRSNGKIVFTGTMNPGDRQNLVLGGNVSLTLGNAGQMDVSIDGQPARSFGGEGEVVTKLMNIQNLKTFLEAR